MAEAPPRTPSSWSDIPLDLAGLVLRLLPAHVDRARFAAVCPQWRAAARQMPPPLPLIALPDGAFYSLPRSERFCLSSCTGGYDRACASGSWLVFSCDDSYFMMDPFSMATMPLPAMPLPGLSCVQPRFEADDEPVVVDDETWMKIKNPKGLTMHKLIVCSPHLISALVGFPNIGENQIVVCRPGSPSWSVPAHGRFMRLRGMAFHQGELYALDFNMDLLAVDINVDHSTGDPWVSQIRLVIKAEDALLPMLTDLMTFTGDDEDNEGILTMLYLVESHRALLMVHRKIWCIRFTLFCNGGNPRSYVVPTKSEFEVFEADFGRSRWNKVTTVGDDQVLFLAQWSSRAVCVSKYGMPGNRIFFWDDDLYHDECEYYFDYESLSSCSAYDMGDGTVSSPLPMISWKYGMVPVTWLFPQD